MAKNIVLCLDGTNNKIRGERFLTQDGQKSAVNSNVARFYDALDLSDRTQQIAFYQPGVGTFGAVGTWTPASREFTRILGLALGYGLRRNLAEAFAFLADHYESGDQIYLVGFSRGAYTVRALSGMLELVGILRPGASNLVPSVVTEYTRDSHQQHGDSEYFDRVRIFSSMFSERLLDRHGHVPIRFVGLWDTVEAAGSLRGRTKWAFTSYLPHAEVVRHAVAIDEQRRPYREYLVTPLTGSPRSPRSHLFPLADQDLEEVWFAGVHSDVGGMFKEGSRISDIPLNWMLREADRAGMVVRPGKQQHIADMAAEVPADAPPHVMEGLWKLIGKRVRRVPHRAMVHDSVRERRERDPRYGRHFPDDIRYVDRGWRH